MMMRKKKYILWFQKDVNEVENEEPGEIKLSKPKIKSKAP